ncbi:hypothetical protein RchiOBHm_Chr7g0206381 [Rosa chinensis]|uniref:Uncharacterized protein n=1 Tax=Rosa chinensis TaxID=74649 RepID=A0A2P6P965_ROSCH|nr:hypothetical protein RchiOBHm_Chr7g0206381 [Rosa chinensis]
MDFSSLSLFFLSLISCLWCCLMCIDIYLCVTSHGFRVLKPKFSFIWFYVWFRFFPP